MSDLPIICDIDDGWATIWLNRPEVRNALSQEVTGLLLSTLNALRDEPELRGLTIRGRGGTFCAGGDIKGFKSNMQGDGQGVDDVARTSAQAGELFSEINTFPHPVIMLVDGAAMAGGMGMVCAGDIVIVVEDTKFALTETTLGIPPAQIAPFVMQRLGLSTARRLMLTAARFDGAEALRIGLADFMAPDLVNAEIIEAGLRKDVKKCAPGANSITKDIVLAARYLRGEEMRAYAGHGFARAMLSDEGREGVSAFIEKRKPSWTQ